MNEKNESIETQAQLELFRQELESAVDCVKDLKARMAFDGFESYKNIVGHDDEIMLILKKQFGFDIEKANESLVGQYSISGTPGTAGEGEIQVSIFGTNDKDVFIGKYRYSDGDTAWVLRPLKYDD